MLDTLLLIHSDRAVPSTLKMRWGCVSCGFLLPPATLQITKAEVSQSLGLDLFESWFRYGTERATHGMKSNMARLSAIDFSGSRIVSLALSLPRCSNVC
ncbi:hypothetical protein Mapa_013831 [Marchantia paleacea]|nr:hypothetical protein Mapa_013831 [Marchantia paleacea]